MAAPISASVLCPGLINTRILEAERNRADRFGSPTDLAALRPDLQQFAAGFEAALRSGYPPEVVADHVVDGIRQDRFYLLPVQPEIMDRVDTRFRGFLDRANPTPRP